jgi:hypothetical protein
MQFPAKISFSARYSRDGICGALGLLDKGVSEESDIIRTCVTLGTLVKGESGAKEEDPGVRWSGGVRLINIRGSN